MNAPVRSLFIFAISWAVLFLSGCATTKRLPQTCDYGGPWSDQVQDHAKKVWLYAQISANAYEREDGSPLDPFILPSNIQPQTASPNDSGGMAYRAYLIPKTEGAAERLVIAYRGSERHNFSVAIDDWIWGNLMGGQNDNALRAFDDIVREFGHNSVGQYKQIILTGHSLGGALATHVSLNSNLADENSKLESHVFNSSPRFRNLMDMQADRTSTVEKGEFAHLFRWFGREPNQKYTSLNCRSGFAPGRDHSVVALAKCLTAIAAPRDRSAETSMNINDFEEDFSKLPPCQPYPNLPH